MSTPTPVARLKHELNEARRAAATAPTRGERKYWKSRVHDLTEQLLEAEGRITRTFDERYGPTARELKT